MLELSIQGVEPLTHDKSTQSGGSTDLSDLPSILPGTIDLDFQRHMSRSYYFQLLKVALSTINQWLRRNMVFRFTDIGGIIDHGTMYQETLDVCRTFRDIPVSVETRCTKKHYTSTEHFVIHECTAFCFT